MQVDAVIVGVIMMLAGLVVGAGVPMVAYDKIDGNSVLNGGKFTLIAGVFSLLAAILWFWYPLHKKQVDENVALLKKKHVEEETW